MKVLIVLAFALTSTAALADPVFWFQTIARAYQGAEAWQCNGNSYYVVFSMPPTGIAPSSRPLAERERSGVEAFCTTAEVESKGQCALDTSRVASSLPSCEQRMRDPATRASILSICNEEDSPAIQTCLTQYENNPPQRYLIRHGQNSAASTVAENSTCEVSFVNQTIQGLSCNESQQSKIDEASANYNNAIFPEACYGQVDKQECTLQDLRDRLVTH